MKLIFKTPKASSVHMKSFLEKHSYNLDSSLLTEKISNNKTLDVFYFSFKAQPTRGEINFDIDYDYYDEYRCYDFTATKRYLIRRED